MIQPNDDDKENESINQTPSYKRQKFSMCQKDFIQPAPLLNKVSNFAIIQTECLAQIFTSTNKKNVHKKRYISKTDYKKKPSSFIKVSDNELNPIKELILDDFDKKNFDSISLLFLPPINDLIQKISPNEINDEDFALYSYISYILYYNNDNKDLSQVKLSLLKVIPIHKISNVINKSDRGILNMILNCIIFSIDNEEIAKTLIQIKTFNIFLKNLYSILNNTRHYRVKRKITAIFTLLFYYNSDFLISDFVKFHSVIDKIKLGSVIVIKLYHLLKEKQRKVIDEIIIAKDFNNNPRVYKNFHILDCLLEISEAELIYEERKYVELFRFIRLSQRVNSSIINFVRELKKKINTF